MVKNVLGDTDLSLTADAGKALLVLGLRVYNPVDDYVTVKTDRTSVGYFRVGGEQGNHLFYPTDNEHEINLLDWLIAMNFHRGFPVPEGATFELTGAAQADAVQTALYQVLDAGDIRGDQPNGPDSDSYDFMNYGRYNTVLTDDDNLFDTPQTTAEFPAFPWDALSPAGKKVTLFGLAFSEIGTTSASQANQHISRYVKMIQERKVLFDDDRNGLLYEGIASTSADQTDVATGQAMGGNRSSVDRCAPLVFASPLVFPGNSELDVYVTTEVVAGVANLAAADVELAFIERVESD